MSRGTVYLAGPMRGYENYNFDAFDDAATLLRNRGWAVINPAEIDRDEEGWDKYPPQDFTLSREKRLEIVSRDIDAILSCDAIYMLRGWEHSLGALAERAVAKWLTLNILYQTEDREQGLFYEG